MKLIEQLRDDLPELSIVANCGGGSFKSQMKRADKSQANLALIIGEDELAAANVSVKPLRTAGEQSKVELQSLSGFLRQQVFE